MKNQVTTIEQSKRLIEMGVPAERASMLWEMDEDCARLKIWNTDESTRRVIHNKYPDYYCPAFTVADLLGVMPKEIPTAVDQSHDYALTISYRFCWRIYYEDNLTHRRIGEEMDFDLIDILCNSIEWLVSNGYKLEV